jgi:thiamine-phosphate pyrophosphorylase
VQLYAITDRKRFPSPEAFVDHVAQWAKDGIDYIQIREKDLATAELTGLVTQLVSAVRSAQTLTQHCTRILLNSPAQMAAETGCDGVHLTANLPVSAIADARAAMRSFIADPVISVSCHTLSDIERARDQGATLAIFAPVFEKQWGAESTPGQGLEALAAACRLASPIPVFALGGVTEENAHACVQAGAAGVAAIRLFRSGNWMSLRTQPPDKS